MRFVHIVKHVCHNFIMRITHECLMTTNILDLLDLLPALIGKQSLRLWQTTGFCHFSPASPAPPAEETTTEKALSAAFFHQMRQNL
jgi:hypothetical protein